MKRQRCHTRPPSEPSDIRGISGSEGRSTCTSDPVIKYVSPELRRHWIIIVIVVDTVSRKMTVSKTRVASGYTISISLTCRFRDGNTLDVKLPLSICYSFIYFIYYTVYHYSRNLFWLDPYYPILFPPTTTDDKIYHTSLFRTDYPTVHLSWLPPLSGLYGTTIDPPVRSISPWSFTGFLPSQFLHPSLFFG